MLQRGADAGEWPALAVEVLGVVDLIVGKVAPPSSSR
jgi:hypothetical protein